MPRNGRWSLDEDKRKPQHRAERIVDTKERNPILADYETCWRCGSRDRNLCGH